MGFLNSTFGVQGKKWNYQERLHIRRELWLVSQSLSSPTYNLASDVNQSIMKKILQRQKYYLIPDQNNWATFWPNVLTTTSKDESANPNSLLSREKTFSCAIIQTDCKCSPKLRSRRHNLPRLKCNHNAGWFKGEFETHVQCNYMNHWQEKSLHAGMQVANAGSFPNSSW